MGRTANWNLSSALPSCPATKTSLGTTPTHRMNATNHVKSDNASGALRCVRLALVILLTSVVLLASVSSARGAIITLDLTSGTDSVTGGTLVGFDTYEESGF